MLPFNFSGFVFSSDYDTDDDRKTTPTKITVKASLQSKDSSLILDDSNIDDDSPAPARK